MEHDEAAVNAETQTVTQEPGNAPENAEALRARLEAQQSLMMGLLAGISAAIVGAAIWAGITVATGYQIGLIAMGVGLLVGFAVRTLGKGVSSIFGIVGAVCALFGCVLGNLLSTCGFISIQESLPFFDVVIAVFRQPAVAIELMAETFSPIDLLFYGIAVYEGYRFSFRKIGPEELGAHSGEE